jgi:hypothetical protein
MSPLICSDKNKYKNEPGYEDYDKPANPPTPVSTPPTTTSLTTLAPFLTTTIASIHRRSTGDEKEAKAYIRKIHHETLRVSVIQRLEEYVGISTEPILPSAGVQDDESDDETRRASPGPPEVKMWVDQCKRTFLWYYHIYFVRPLSIRD